MKDLTEHEEYLKYRKAQLAYLKKLNQKMESLRLQIAFHQGQAIETRNFLRWRKASEAKRIAKSGK